MVKQSLKFTNLFLNLVWSMFKKCAFSQNNFFSPFIFIWVFVYMYLCRPSEASTVLHHPRWLPTSGLTEFAVCWGGAGFKPRTTDLQSGALPLSHLSSKTMHLSEMQQPQITEKSDYVIYFGRVRYSQRLVCCI
jgi:hypothetical protein